MAKEFDHRLPAEDELAEMLNVSRTTIRTALHSLEQEGIVTRRRAIGTTINSHVRPSTLALQRLVGFDGMLEEKGYDVRVEVEATRGTVPEDIVEVFGLDADEVVLLTEKRYYADGVMAICLRDAIPASELSSAEIEEPIPPSMFDFSRRYCRRPVDHAVVEIVAKIQRAGSRTQLAVDEGDPYTRLHERHYSSSGEPIAVSIIDVDNKYVRFEVFRRQ
jgi:GntR family transcriptional regulator